MSFHDWMKSIHGTEKEAEIDKIAAEAERQREEDDDLFWNLHWERNEWYAG